MELLWGLGRGIRYAVRWVLDHGPKKQPMYVPGACAQHRGTWGVVTGPTSGIGRCVAEAVAKDGINVICGCRDAKVGERVAAEIRSAVGEGVQVVSIALDLSSMASIRRFAEKVQEMKVPLHLLVNNAAAFVTEFALTEDGFETQMQINHLGPFLLTRLLLPQLQSASAARVVFVSSEAHRHGTCLSVDTIAHRGPAMRYSAWKTYSQTKFANIVAAYEWNRRLSGTTNVRFNAVHPGVYATATVCSADHFPLRRTNRRPHVPQSQHRHVQSPSETAACRHQMAREALHADSGGGRSHRRRSCAVSRLRRARWEVCHRRSDS